MKICLNETVEKPSLLSKNDQSCITVNFIALFLYRNIRSQKLTASNKTLFQAWVTLPILWITKTVNKHV